MEKRVEEEIRLFLEAWQETPARNKQAFAQLKDLLFRMGGIQVEYHPRPGLTYSLRASIAHRRRPLFVMIDVIEDTPRWLSVCFFNDTVQDPEEIGAFVPGGLLGEDALCFDLETYDESTLRYVEARIKEACQAAREGD